MDDAFHLAIAAELQGLALSAEGARRAGNAAFSLQDAIAGSAQKRLRFDDGPYDYAALLLEFAKRHTRG